MGEERDFSSLTARDLKNNTITANGETNYEDYQRKNDSQKLDVLLNSTQFANFGGFRSPPNITQINRQPPVTYQPPDLGRKNEYFFGKVTSGEHNTSRSESMALQLKGIGLSDTPESRTYLNSLLTRSYNNQNSITGTFPSRFNPLISVTERQFLITGPTGSLKARSFWEGNRLTSMQLYGPRVGKERR